MGNNQATHKLGEGVQWYCTRPRCYGHAAPHLLPRQMYSRCSLPSLLPIRQLRLFILSFVARRLLLPQPSQPSHPVNQYQNVPPHVRVHALHVGEFSCCKLGQIQYLRSHGTLVNTRPLTPPAKTRKRGASPTQSSALTQSSNPREPSTIKNHSVTVPKTLDQNPTSSTPCKIVCVCVCARAHACMRVFVCVGMCVRAYRGVNIRSWPLRSEYKVLTPNPPQDPKP